MATVYSSIVGNGIYSQKSSLEIVEIYLISVNIVSSSSDLPPKSVK
jgi:hypothetical protein